jgi:acylpyruvate hydrolase
MKLVTFTHKRETRIGALIGVEPGEAGGFVLDLAPAAKAAARRAGKASALAGIDSMVGLLEAGRGAMAEARKLVRETERVLATASTVPAGLARVLLPAKAVRLQAPIPRPPKFVCVGLNYRDHAAEVGAQLPAAPVLFSKFSSSVIGPGETIRIPAATSQADYEAELAIVIGKRAKDVAKDKAFDVIAGYTIVNDVSARDLQFARNQWLAGKTPDTFGVMGPALVTADEIDDPHALDVRTFVNGERRQNSNTNQLVFGIAELIADMSRLWTLEPGDVIATGTPGGVGISFKPPRYLKAGDRVRVEIEKLGSLENPVA